MMKAVIFDMYETLITHYNCPLYFGGEIAADMGISERQFREIWDGTESQRSVGERSFEQVIADIMIANNCYEKETLALIVEKRVETKKLLFRCLHEEILPMLKSLQEKQIKIGLISNCFSEEAIVIKESILYPYFDAALLSWDERMQKPDKRIFYRCLEILACKPEECIYIGDGGSYELETAREIGMHAMQAVWYTCSRKKEFAQIENPLEILNLL